MFAFDWRKALLEVSSQRQNTKSVSRDEDVAEINEKDEVWWRGECVYGPAESRWTPRATREVRRLRDPCGVEVLKGKLAVADKECVTVFEKNKNGWRAMSERKLKNPTAVVRCREELFVCECDNNAIAVLKNDSIYRFPANKLLDGPLDVACLLLEPKRPCPRWFLGSVDSEEAARCMQDSRVGDWRLRRRKEFGDDALSLCYVTKKAWLRADVDELKIVEKNIEGFFEATIDDTIQRRTLTELLTVLISLLSLDGAPLTVNRAFSESAILVAVAAKNGLHLFHYAPPRKNFFDAAYAYFGSRQASPRSVAFLPSSGDLLFAEKNDHISVLSAPAYTNIAVTVSFPRIVSPPILRVWQGGIIVLWEQRRSTLAGPLKRDVGPILGRWPPFMVEGLCEHLGYVDSTRSLKRTCRAMRDVLLELKRDWRLAPFDRRARDKADTVFDKWSHSSSRRRSKSSFQERELARLKARRLATEVYALRSDAENCREVLLLREEQARMDFGGGALCAVTATYGAKLWWRWRGALAEIFTSFATTKENLLNRDSFLQFWARIHEHVLGFRPWPKPQQAAARLLATTADSFGARTEAERLGHILAKSTPPMLSDLVDAHLKAVVYYADQNARAVDRAFG